MTTPTPYVADRTTAAWQELDRQHYLHPFTDYKFLHAKGTRVIVKAEGVYLYDSEGNRILDGMAGLWCVNLGYGRRELAEAAYRQMLELPYYNSFFQTRPPAGDRAREAARRPDAAAVQPRVLHRLGLARATTRWSAWCAATGTCSGSRSARSSSVASTRTTAARWRARASAAWRSCTSRAGCRSRTSSTSRSRTGSPTAATCRRPSSGSRRPASSRAKIVELGAHRVAAFIGEPIQGAGGVIIPPETYWPEIQKICDRYGILLVADEVICGFGRTGHWFGSNLYGLRPDLMTIAKGLSSGYLPIGGVMVGDRVADVLIDKGGEFAHGYTYSGHPVACAVASVNLSLIQQEGLVTRTRDETGPYLASKWKALAEHPLVGEARSVGLIGALELVRDKKRRQFFDKRGEVGTICRDFCFQNGLIMRAVRDTMIISPPLVISREQLDELAEKAWRCLDLTLERCRAEGRL